MKKMITIAVFSLLLAGCASSASMRKSPCACDFHDLSTTA